MSASGRRRVRKAYPKQLATESLVPVFSKMLAEKPRHLQR